MNCPVCRAGFVSVLTSCPVRRYQCAACNHVWTEEHDTAPPPTLPTGVLRIEGPREWLENVGRTIAVALGPGSGRAEWDGIEVIDTGRHGAAAKGVGA